MELKFDKCKYHIDREGFWLSIRVLDINKAKQFIENIKNRLYIADLKVFRRKRSLNANACCWALLQKMAEKLNSSKDEMYLQMLAKYGQFTHVIVKPEAVDRVKEEWRVTEVLGEVMVNGRSGIQMRCYFGSHTYNTKEMSFLISGIVHECEELGIETPDDREINRMKEEWASEKA